MQKESSSPEKLKYTCMMAFLFFFASEGLTLSTFQHMNNHTHVNKMGSFMDETHTSAFVH